MNPPAPISRSRRLFARFVAFALLYSLPAGAKSASGERETLTLTTNLLSPFFGAYYLEINVRVSSALGTLFNASHFSLDEGEWMTRTTTVGAGVAYHFEGNALRSWYLEAQSELLLSPWRHEPSGRTSSVELGVSAAGLAGYRFVCEFGPVLDLGLGVVVLHFPSARVETDFGRVSSPALTRPYPAAKINVGWAF